MENLVAIMRRGDIPALTQAAIPRAHFETIHPLEGTAAPGGPDDVRSQCRAATGALSDWLLRAWRGRFEDGTRQRRVGYPSGVFRASGGFPRLVDLFLLCLCGRGRGQDSECGCCPGIESWTPSPEPACRRVFLVGGQLDVVPVTDFIRHAPGQEVAFRGEPAGLILRGLVEVRSQGIIVGLLPGRQIVEEVRG